MNIKDKIKAYFSKKSKFGIASDIFFVVFIIALIIPQSRMEVAAFVNKIKVAIMQPSVKKQDEAVKLSSADYEMVFHDLQGQSHDFTDLKGKVIFLNLWATWCPPCVAEMPSIQELYDKYKNNDDIVFLMVSNEEKDKVKQFMSRKEYTFPALINKFKMPDVFFTKSIPTTFVISKSGEIIVRELGAANWAGDRMIETINQLLNE